MGRWQEQKSDRPSQNANNCSVISIYNFQKDLQLNKSSIKALVQKILNYLKISHKNLSVYFVTKKKISQLHETYFQDPSPTDCISFPMNDEDDLGEIFVCPRIAMEYAGKKNLDPTQETLLYIIHGILHLIGYDDLEEKQRRAMRKMEKKCMAHLRDQK